MSKDRVTKKVFVFFICLMIVISSCTYKDRVQPIPLAGANQNALNVNGLYVSAVAYVDEKAAEKAFGFNIRQAGLLPIQVSFQNEGAQSVEVISEQTFLLDSKNQAWPINTQERTYQRIEKHTDVGETVAGAGKPALLLGAAGAVAGLAIGIITGENIGEAVGKGAVIGATAGVLGGGASGYSKAEGKIRNDLRSKTLTSSLIGPNQIAYGFLFFPGFPEEAQDAKLLKLTLGFDEGMQTVNLNLNTAP
ncbi:MAG: hypothetical protein RBT11_13605 [Desulfobacterales bacterium]|jgi:outer membrane lipoprotein SlyB|nr:hypothetical protein [Desulfobacterales bacterium]